MSLELRAGKTVLSSSLWGMGPTFLSIPTRPDSVSPPHCLSLQCCLVQNIPPRPHTQLGAHEPFLPGSQAAWHPGLAGNEESHTCWDFLQFCTKLSTRLQLLSPPRPGSSLPPPCSASAPARSRLQPRHLQLLPSSFLPLPTFIQRSSHRPGKQQLISCQWLDHSPLRGDQLHLCLAKVFLPLRFES